MMSLKDTAINNYSVQTPPDETSISLSPHEANPNTEKNQCRWFRLLRKIIAPKTLCPEINLPIQFITYIVLILLFWGVSYSLLQDLVSPSSNLFQLIILFILSYIAGQLVAIIHLPPLLGMLILGITLRNVGYFNMTGIYLDIVSALRKIAMTVILIKAGLGLDAGALRRLSFVVIRLAFIPCLIETATVAVVSHFLLGFSWLWGFLLGFVLAAVSPAVVVPSLLVLKEDGFGEDKGISTLVIAASSIDDIIAISGFGVVLGSIFSTGDWTDQLLHGPLEVLIGVTFGTVWGILCMYIPHRKDSRVGVWRACMVGGGGLFAVLGSNLIDYSGAGPLACILAAFIACCSWKAQGWTSVYNPVSETFSIIWLVFQPVLFGLIGTEINLFELEGRTVGLGLAVLFLGLIIRILTVFVITLGGTLNFRERMFVGIAWLPKATVQAALGPVALDIANVNKSSDEVIELARQLLTIAVLSILITAPIGAVGIAVAGRRLLNRKLPEREELSQESTRLPD